MRVQPVDRVSMYSIKSNRFKTMQQTKNLYNLIFTNNKEKEIWLAKAKRKGNKFPQQV